MTTFFRERAKKRAATSSLWIHSGKGTCGISVDLAGPSSNARSTSKTTTMRQLRTLLDENQSTLVRVDTDLKWTLERERGFRESAAKNMELMKDERKRADKMIAQKAALESRICAIKLEMAELEQARRDEVPFPIPRRPPNAPPLLLLNQLEQGDVRAEREPHLQHQEQQLKKEVPLPDDSPSSQPPDPFPPTGLPHGPDHAQSNMHNHGDHAEPPNNHDMDMDSLSEVPLV